MSQEAKAPVELLRVTVVDTGQKFTCRTSTTIEGIQADQAGGAYAIAVGALLSAFDRFLRDTLKLPEGEDAVKAAVIGFEKQLALTRGATPTALASASSDKPLTPGQTAHVRALGKTLDAQSTAPADPTKG